MENQIKLLLALEKAQKLGLEFKLDSEGGPEIGSTGGILCSCFEITRYSGRGDRIGKELTTVYTKQQANSIKKLLTDGSINRYEFEIEKKLQTFTLEDIEKYILIRTQETIYEIRSESQIYDIISGRLK